MKLLVLFYDRAARLLQPIRDAAQSDWQLEEWRLGDSAARLEELLALAVVIVAGPGFPASALGKTRNLRLLQCASAGYEWIDFDAVPPTAHVCNTSSMDASIAEYVLCAILEWQVGCMRADRALRAARCIVPPFGAPGQRGLAPFHGEAGGKTLGIVGLGAIGEQVARRAAALDMRVLATTGRPRRATQPLPQGVAWRGAGDGADLERLLRESDFVVLCCALTPATRGLIDERRWPDCAPPSLLRDPLTPLGCSSDSRCSSRPPCSSTSDAALRRLNPTQAPRPLPPTRLSRISRVGGLCEERPLYKAVRDHLACRRPMRGAAAVRSRARSAHRGGGARRVVAISQRGERRDVAVSVSIPRADQCGHDAALFRMDGGARGAQEGAGREQHRRSRFRRAALALPAAGY